MPRRYIQVQVCTGVAQVLLIQFYFKQLILNLFLRRFGLVWFGFDRRFEQTDKTNGFWFALIEFGLVWFAYSTDTQTNK